MRPLRGIDANLQGGSEVLRRQAFLIGEVRNGALHPQLVRVIETGAERGFMVGSKYYEIGGSNRERMFDE